MRLRILFGVAGALMLGTCPAWANALNFGVIKSTKSTLNRMGAPSATLLRGTPLEVLHVSGNTLTIRTCLGIGTCRKSDVRTLSADEISHALQWYDIVSAMYSEAVAQSPPAPEESPRVAFADTVEKFHKVQVSGGYAHYKNAAYTSGVFGADIEILDGLLKATKKPSQLDISVVLFGSDGSIVGRSTAHIYNVMSSGGQYSLEQPMSVTSEPVACTITLQSAWVRHGE